VTRNINNSRHPIPDAPVLYLVEPTPKNLEIITSDLSQGLYFPAYINFLHSIPRPLLENFASQTALSGTADSIAQIYDQYLNFVVGEPYLFSLSMGSGTYWAMNSPETSDEDIDVAVDRMVSGLFSVVVTMGTSSH
jgi:sec1 family domain-containing protein 1